MPELAEVETLRRGIEHELVGRSVVRVAATGVRSLRRHPDRSEFVSRVEGRSLVAASRRGKYLVLRLDDRQAVIAHMGMSGQLRVVPTMAHMFKHTHVVLGFSGGCDLRFVDPRTFGEMWVTDTGHEGVVAELARLGLDPLDTSPGADRRLAALLAARATRIKPLLMDQTRIAGIGNMYADEILFAARIHPSRPASSLSRPEVRRLQAAMVDVLTRAVDHRGSSLSDEQYRDIYGQVGDYQQFHAVYARAGAPCPRCGRPIQRMVSAGRSSFFCTRCQPAMPRPRKGSTNSALAPGTV